MAVGFGFVFGGVLENTPSIYNDSGPASPGPFDYQTIIKRPGRRPRHRPSYDLVPLVVIQIASPVRTPRPSSITSILRCSGSLIRQEAPGALLTARTASIRPQQQQRGHGRGLGCRCRRSPIIRMPDSGYGSSNACLLKKRRRTKTLRRTPKFSSDNWNRANPSWKRGTPRSNCWRPRLSRLGTCAGRGSSARMAGT